MRHAVVTGGGGFIGAHLVRRLLRDGWDVTVVDNMLRGAPWRLDSVRADVTIANIDVRDAEALARAAKGADVMFHLAAVNGTENFYKQPELVLDVGIRGALAAVTACQQAGVPDLVLASSAEVYQTPPVVPTDETVALTLPDSLNPRYSYGGSKIISELIAFNYGQDHFRKVQVFRPHNVYGPDMGYKHVVPQFLLRAMKAHETASGPGVTADFAILGSGTEQRAFCYVDDIVDGIILMYLKGGHREVYHIGNDDMVSVATLAACVGEAVGLELNIVPSTAPAGETPLRCPSIEKMRRLGYAPSVSLREGLALTLQWYREHADKAVENEFL
ncbi:NAD-dependent epimerase/dehydratase family protein [Kordiimonas sp.]|uniref:NAD-dependent epimerase/dehydratase family protein n=1 Tax=Kordiimonas sp. TaxID=1970157 RepID=UPI003A93C006